MSCSNLESILPLLLWLHSIHPHLHLSLLYTSPSHEYTCVSGIQRPRNTTQVSLAPIQSLIHQWLFIVLFLGCSYWRAWGISWMFQYQDNHSLFCLLLSLILTVAIDCFLILCHSDREELPSCVSFMILCSPNHLPVLCSLLRYYATDCSGSMGDSRPTLPYISVSHPS